MVPVPPIILVFDVNVIAITTPSEWREFSRVGTCFIPQVVFEEISQAFARAGDRDLGKIAKSFNHYLPISGWHLTDASAHHAVFKLKSDQPYTHRTRIALSVGRCAYRLSELFPKSLVILVSKDRSQLQRLYEVPAVNLCAITGEALLLWSRNGRRPIAVTQKLHQFRAAYNINPPLADLQTSTSTFATDAKLTQAETQTALARPRKSIATRLIEQPWWVWFTSGIAIGSCLCFLLKSISCSQTSLTNPPLHSQSL